MFCLDHPASPACPCPSWLVPILLGLSLPAAGFAQWKPVASIAARESYDTNVFLQDVGDLAHRNSMVTTVNPTASLSYAPEHSDTRLSLSYSPDANFYHSEPDEDYVRNPISLNASGRLADHLTFDTTNCLTYIAGPDQSPIFTGPGGGPANSGAPVRDRRDALVLRDALQFKYARDAWFLRPLISSYVHDFRSDHSPVPGYANYVDRSDANGGLDAGLKILPDTFATLGYRYGQQTQDRLLGNPLRYSNSYHRLLAGVEGKPAPWLKLAAAAGPDFRSFGPEVAPDFGRDRVDLFADASVTLILSKDDELSFSYRSFVQPASGGRAIYDDVTYAVSVRHRFTPAVSVAAGFKAYRCDVDPVARDEWIYTPSVSLSYRLGNHLSAEVSWLYDRARSEIPNTQGREYDRHVVAAGVKYEF